LKINNEIIKQQKNGNKLKLEKLNDKSEYLENKL
jgi:hypothetical protein